MYRVNTVMVVSELIVSELTVLEPAQPVLYTMIKENPLDKMR